MALLLGTPVYCGRPNARGFIGTLTYLLENDIFSVKTMITDIILNVKILSRLRVDRRLRFAVFWIFVAFGGTGCAGRLTSSLAGALIDDVAMATAKHDDIILVSQGIPTYLLLLEGLLESHPNDARLLTSASEAYTSYAILLELDDPERANRLYARGKKYGLKALASNKKLAPLLGAPFSEFSTIRQHLKPSDLPRVFWAASSWGAWISTNLESMHALAQLPKVILLMEWTVEIDGSFQYASPHLFLGVYYASLPPMLGGNPDKALAHFDRAIELTGGQSLMALVLKARYYARQIFDRELHDALLKKALSQRTNTIPELTLQNEIAQKMARTLLEGSNEFF